MSRTAHWQGPKPQADVYRQLADEAFASQPETPQPGQRLMSRPNLSHIGPIWMNGVIDVDAEIRHNKASELLRIELGERVCRYLIVEEFLGDLYKMITCDE